MAEMNENNCEGRVDDIEGAQLAEWIEDVLKTYCSNLAKRNMSPGFTGSSNTAKVAQTSSSVADIKKNIYLFVTSIKFQKYKSCTVHTSEDKLEVEIRYFLGDATVERKENFLINISRTLPNSNRSVQKLLATDKREIDFYTKLISDLEDWALTLGITLKFAIPTCFFGQYEIEKPPKFDHQLSHISTDINPDILVEHDIQRMAILILHNLEEIGFKPAGEPSQLKIEEIKAVLSEIAKIHATSWAYQIKTKKMLRDQWGFLLRTREAVPMFMTLIDHGVTNLLKVLRTRIKNRPVMRDISRRLAAIRDRLPTTLQILLTPPKYPCPTSVLHLDLNSKNIFFRHISGNSLPVNHSYKCEDIECRITQWKLVTIGSPMHDVAFLFLTSLNSKDRRLYAQQLVEFYYQAFKDTAKKLEARLPFKLSLLQREYEKSLFFAQLLLIGNFQEQMMDISKEGMESFLAGLEDVADSGFL